ncbi:MAG: DNA invertase [Acidobacteria bacterium]|nr:DNA invertase [Acidobacteriota bacterium]
MTKAFAYLRVSGKGQISGDGFTRQLTAIREYAKANGIRIAKVYREEGVSGTKDLDDRPALAAMIEDLHSNGTRLVLIEKLDRLARDLMVQETIIGDLRKSNFELVSVTEPDLLKDDPTRTLMRQVFGAIAEYEKAMIVMKLRGARNRAKARTGRCEGRKPYGHYPGEQKVIERMESLRASGMAYDKLAAQLTAEGFRTRKGTAWHGFGVQRIMKRMTDA